MLSNLLDLVIIHANPAALASYTRMKLQRLTINHQRDEEG